MFSDILSLITYVLGAGASIALIPWLLMRRTDKGFCRQALGVGCLVGLVSYFSPMNVIYFLLASSVFTLTVIAVLKKQRDS